MSRDHIQPDGSVSSLRGKKRSKHRDLSLSQAQAHQPKPSSESHDSHPLTPREHFAQFYGFTLPPPSPLSGDSNGYPCEYEGGIIQSSRANFVSPPTPTSPLLCDSDELLAKFHKLFVHSQTQVSTTTSGEQCSPKRSNVAHSAPDVKSKTRKHSMPAVGGDNDKQEIFTSFTNKRPTFETRTWSYDSFKTYPIMKLPPKKEKCIVKKIVDGEERDVEVESEVYVKPKVLFRFALKVVPHYSG